MRIIGKNGDEDGDTNHSRLTMNREQVQGDSYHVVENVTCGGWMRMMMMIIIIIVCSDNEEKVICRAGSVDGWEERKGRIFVSSE